MVAIHLIDKKRDSRFDHEGFTIFTMFGCIWDILLYFIYTILLIELYLYQCPFFVITCILYNMVLTSRQNVTLYLLYG